MNNNNIFLETAQKGFHITVGAATALIETVQNPQKRSETISQIQSELNQKAQEWSEKGAVTEQEAKTFLNDLIQQQPWSKKQTSTTNSSNNTYSSNQDVHGGLQELKEDIVALRSELEKMRQSKNES